MEETTGQTQETSLQRGHRLLRSDNLSNAGITIGFSAIALGLLYFANSISIIRQVLVMLAGLYLLATTWELLMAKTNGERIGFAVKIAILASYIGLYLVGK